jgi:hypothetical protein
MLDLNLNGKIAPLSIDKKAINQLEVWQWLLGQTVFLEDRFCNPWRNDMHPNCYLTGYRGMVLLKDFGTPFHNWTIYRAVCHTMITPFPSSGDVKKHFQKILTLIASRSENFNPKKYEMPNEQYNPALYSRDRKWTQKDLQDWAVFGIVREQLESDKVFPVETYWLNSRKTGEFMSFSPKGMYDIPVGQGKKLYSMSPKRFITNIGDTLNGIDKGHKTAYVAKFYKDYRVIANLGLSAYYTNGETTGIPEEGIKELDKNHDRIFIIRDDDAAGRNSAELICKQAGKDKFKPLFTQTAKDPSDVVKLFNYQTLAHELKI